MSAALRKDFSSNLGRIIPAVNVRILEAPPETTDTDEAAQGVTSEVSTPCHDTEVVLLKDGDRVKTIVINCACGRVISLDCTY